MNLPRWAKLSKQEKEYWWLLEPEFTKAGTLTNGTLPEFVKLLKNIVRRDEIDRYIAKNNQSFLQEAIFVDSAGQQHSVFKESAYSKLSRDYDRMIMHQMKIFRSKPKEKEDKKAKDDILD